MSARANKRRINQRFFGRFHANFLWRSAEDLAWDNITPVGREFGSPDYERLSILDMYTCGTITESRALGLLNVDRTALLAMLARVKPLLHLQRYRQDHLLIANTAILGG